MTHSFPRFRFRTMVEEDGDGRGMSLSLVLELPLRLSLFGAPSTFEFSPYLQRPPTKILASASDRKVDK